MSRSAEKGFNKAPPKDRARVLKMMKKLAQDGPDDFINTQFKHEGRFRSGQPGAPDIAVYVFKSYQLRVYGGFLETDEGRLFLSTHVKIKKRDQADQKLLQSVANEIGNANVD